jgi:hypothetical protein
MSGRGVYTLAKNLCLVAVLTVPSVLAAETEIGVEDNDLRDVPKTIREAVGYPGKDCKLQGKPIAVPDRSQPLWFVTNTCGGSGGQPILLVYQSSKAKVVLTAGTQLNMKIGDEISHGLPDVIIEGGGNCCGLWSVLHRFDGNEYQKTSHLQSGNFDDFTGIEVPPDVKAVLGDYGANRGCTLSSGPITERGPKQFRGQPARYLLEWGSKVLAFRRQGVRASMTDWEPVTNRAWKRQSRVRAGTVLHRGWRDVYVGVC